MTVRYAKIYRIVNDVDNKIYIGSTRMRLSQRLYQHKQQARMWPTRKIYAHLNSIGWNHVCIQLVEHVNVSDPITAAGAAHVKQREQFHIEQLRQHDKRTCAFVGGTPVCLNKNNVIDKCTHGRKQSRCKDCPESSGICTHRKQLHHCTECSPVRQFCDCCNTWSSNNPEFLAHLRTRKHAQNEGNPLIALFNEPVF